MPNVIVEDGSGVIDANSFISSGEVGVYLAKRGRATAWYAATAAEQDSATIAAADYIEKTFAARFKGSKAFTGLEASAYSVLTLSAQPSPGDTVTLGTQTYTWVSALVSADDVLIGADTTESAANLAGAINATVAGDGVTHGTGTVANSDADADSTGPAVVASAITPGEAGNDIVTTTSTATAVWISGTMLGGDDTVEQPLSFPRTQLYSSSGVAIDGIPTELKHAQAEYAERALSATLDPDPTTETSGGAVIRTKDKVGPIETEVEYASGVIFTATIKPYPAADNLLKKFMFPSGRVYRG